MTKLIRWLATLAYAGVIFYLSSRTWGGPELFPHADKIIHTCLYAGLGFLCAWALRTTTLKGRAMLFPMAAAMAFVYGATDELHQSFVPGRTPSPADLVFDALGGIVGAWLAVRIAHRLRHEQ